MVTPYTPIETYFAQNPTVQTTLEKALGEPGVSNWKNFLIKLSTKVRKITGTFLREIEDKKVSDFDKAKECVRKITPWPEVNVIIMGTALEAIGQGWLACRYFQRPVPKIESESLDAFFERQKAVKEELIKLFSDQDGPNWQNLAYKLSEPRIGQGMGGITMAFIDDIDQFGKEAPRVFFKEIAQWPDATALHLGKALKQMELDQIAYKYFGISLERPRKLPVGIEGTFRNFLEATGLEDDIIEQVAPKWEIFARKIAKQEAFRIKLNKKEFDQIVINLNKSPQEYFKMYLHAYGAMLGATVGSFVQGLYETDECYRGLCEEICELAGDKSYFEKLDKLSKIEPRITPMRGGLDRSFYDVFKVSGLGFTLHDALAQEKSPNWKDVAATLSSHPKYQNRFKDIESCSGFLSSFEQAVPSTMRLLVDALARTSGQFRDVCREICEWGGDLQYFNSLPFPKESVHPNIAHLFEQMAAEQERLRRENVALKQQHEPSPNCSNCHTQKITRLPKCGHAYCDACVEKIKTCVLCHLPIAELQKVFLN